MLKSILLIAAISGGIAAYSQTRETETKLVTVHNGKVVTKARSLSPADLPDRWRLKPGEYLATQDAGVNVVVKDVDVIEVYSRGFTPKQQEAIERAVESWNVGVVRFIYAGEGEGQVTIEYASEKGARHLTDITLINGVIASAEVKIDPGATDPKAIQSIVAHEMGHVLGLPDSRDPKSIMFYKTAGRDKGNGHLGPSLKDLAALLR